MRLLITGGAGFIGSALLRLVLKQTNHYVINVDKLTYAGNIDSLSECEKFKAHRKLMCYEQRAFNQLRARRAWLKSNKTKPNPHPNHGLR